MMKRRRIMLLFGGFGLAITFGTLAVWALLSSGSSVQAAGAILTVVSPDVEVQDAGGSGLRPAVDGEALFENDRVVTGADGRAVITIFDGSTQVLEPETDVTLKTLGTNDRGGLVSSIRQAAGVTWNTVFDTTGQGDAEYSVDTPAAVAAVRDTMFRVVVEADGSTGVWSRQGTVAVSGQGLEELIAADKYTLVALGESPADPFPAPAPLSRLRIEQRSGAFMLLVSPDGFASGLVPPGAPVNQIPLTLISDATSDPQFIEFITVLDGTYKLFLQPGDFGEYDLSIFGATNGWPVCNETRKGTIIGGKSGLAQLRLEVRDGALLGCDLGGPVASDETVLVNVPDGLLRAVIAGTNLIPQVSVLGAAATPSASQTPDAPAGIQVAEQQIPAGSTGTPLPTLAPPPPPLTATPIASPRATSTPNGSAGPASTATSAPPANTPLPPTIIPFSHTPTRTLTPTPTPTTTPTATPTPVPLLSVDIQPSEGSVRVGAGIQMAAIGTFSDGSTRNITVECGWWSDESSIATAYYNTGVVLGYGQGTTTVSVVCVGGGGNIYDSATITVIP